MKKIILAGFGFMGQTHAANICSLPGVELAAVVDRVPKEQLRPVSGNIRTERIEWSKIRDIPFFSTLEEALNCCEADALVIATPTRFHAESILTGIRYGKHIFVEKPLCFSLEDAFEIRKQLDGTGLIFQVGYCVRFMQEYRYLASLINSREYGKLRFLQLYRYTGTPAWGDWKNPDQQDVSRSALFDLNIHDIDFMLSVLGEPKKVTLNSAVQKRFGNAVTDSTWEFADEHLGRIEGGFFPPSTLPFCSGYLAVFDNISLEYRSAAGAVVARHGAEKNDILTFEQDNNAYREEMRAFADSMIHGAQVQCGIEEGLQTLIWCHKLSKGNPDFCVENMRN